MDFVNVTPVTLREHWPVIAQSLDAVLAKAPEDWIKEDVYHAIKSGAASCHLAVGDQGYAGLLVASMARSEFSGTRALHVWVAHNVGDSDVIESGIELLKKMAQLAGVPKITFGSPRKGWAKRFPLVSATYEVPL